MKPMIKDPLTDKQRKAFVREKIMLAREIAKLMKTDLHRTMMDPAINRAASRHGYVNRVLIYTDPALWK